MQMNGARPSSALSNGDLSPNVATLLMRCLTLSRKTRGEDTQTMLLSIRMQIAYIIQQQLAHHLQLHFILSAHYPGSNKSAKKKEKKEKKT